MQQAFDFLLEDPVLKAIHDTFGLPQIPLRPQGFPTLVLLILEQQVSIDSAKATFNKLKAAFPEFLPQDFVGLTDEDFRAFGVSRQKCGYIRGLASALIDGVLDLNSLAQKPAHQVREELLQLKGIGHWTIDIYLMFSLQSPDIIPLGDIAVVKTLKELLDLHDKAAMEARAERWRPYRSYATFLLWHHYLRKRNRTIQY